MTPGRRVWSRLPGALAAVSALLLPGLATAAKAKGKDAPATAAPSEAAPAAEPAAAAAPEGTPAVVRPSVKLLSPEQRARLHFAAGRALMDLGRFAAAELEFSAGHMFFPRAAFLYNLGQALWYQDKLTPALVKLDAALKFKPPPDAALTKLIRADMEKIRLETRGFKKASRPSPPTDPVLLAKVHYELAGAFFEMERFADALTNFRAGYRLAARPGFLLNMATCLEELGEYAEAVRHAEGYIEHAGPTDPNVPLAREIIERSREAIGHDVASVKVLEVTTTAPPPPRRTGVWLGVAIGGGAVAVVGATLLVWLLRARPDWTIDAYGPRVPAL